MTLRELRGRLQEISRQMRDFHGRLETENRGMTTEERTQWDGWADEAASLETRIRDAETAERMSGNLGDQRNDQERFDRQRQNRDLNDPAAPTLPGDELRAFNAWALGVHNTDHEGAQLAERLGFRMSQRSIMLNFDRGCDEAGIPFSAPRDYREAQLQGEARYRIRNERARAAREGRALSVGTTTAGGHTVPDEMMRPLETALLHFSSIRQVATVLSTGTGADLPIPTMNDTSNKGEIIGENAAINEQDVAFGQVVMKAYKYSSKYMKVSVELMQDSSINLAATLGTALGTRLARITNDHFSTGTGTGQPRGLTTDAANSGITAASAGVITWQEVLNLLHSVDVAYRSGSSVGFMCHDTIALRLRKIADTSGMPLWNQGLGSGQPSTIFGYPVRINNSLPTTATSKGLLFGDFSKYLIREVKGIEVIRLDELFAVNHQVAFLAYARYDGRAVDAGTNPFKYLTLT